MSACPWLFLAPFLRTLQHGVTDGRSRWALLGLALPAVISRWRAAFGGYLSLPKWGCLDRGYLQGIGRRLDGNS